MLSFVSQLVSYVSMLCTRPQVMLGEFKNLASGVHFNDEPGFISLYSYLLPIIL